MSLPSASTQPKCSPKPFSVAYSARDSLPSLSVSKVFSAASNGSIHGSLPAKRRDDDHVAVRDRRADGALRRQRHPPARLTGGEGVAVQPRRAEHDQLRVGAAARREHHRRRPRHGDAGTRAAPALASGPAIEGDHERPAHLVADQDHGVAGDDRRAGHAVEVLERPERRAPALGAVGRVGHEPDVGEEDDDALVVGDRGRRRRIVGLVQRASSDPA